MISQKTMPCEKAQSLTDGITLQLSVSENAYKTKPDGKDIRAMKFNRQEISLEQFVEKVKQGHGFCHWFNTTGAFGVKEKKMENFVSANTIFIDIDKASLSMNEYLDSLSMTPTVCYTTPSNNPQNEQYCYRLCYVLTEPIDNVEVYKASYRFIADKLLKEKNTVALDGHVGNVSQYVNGNGNGNCDIVITDNIYNPSLFEISYCEPTSKRKEPTVPTEKDYSKLISDIQFIEDFHKLSPVALRDKYDEKYPFFDKSPLIKMEGYYIYPEDYTEIKRICRWDDFAKSEKEKIFFKSRKLIRDGEGRRNKLFTGCLIRRQINPEVTFEHLLMNLVCERLYYFDNSDKVLTNKILMGIAYNALMIPLEKITIPRHRPHDFCVDKDYCDANGITVSKMCGDVRHKQRIQTDEIIGQYYDWNLSMRKNTKLLKEKYGLKVSLTRVEQFANDYKGDHS